MSGAEKLDISESRREIPGKYVVLEDDGKDQLDQSCERYRSVTNSQEISAIH